METLWEIVRCSEISLLEEARFLAPPLPNYNLNDSTSFLHSSDGGRFFGDYDFGNNGSSPLFGNGSGGTEGAGFIRSGGAHRNFTPSNFTFPCVDMPDLPAQDMFKTVMKKLNLYFTPVVIVIGITGNLLAFLVFTVTHLRRQSSSVYLASLAMADMGFLLSLFIVWLTSVKISLFTRHIWCQAVVYMTYVCTFLSVWYVVSFTVERYIIVWYPLRKDRYCTPKRARIVVLTLACAACVIYSFAPLTSGVVEVLRVPLCIPFPHYYHFLTAMEGLDSTLTLIIPSTIVIVLNIRIIIKIINVDRQRRPFIRHHHQAVVGGGGGGGAGGVGAAIARCPHSLPISEHKFSVHDSISGTGHIVHVKFRSQMSANSGGALTDRPANNGNMNNNAGVASLSVNNSPEHHRCSHSHSQSSDHKSRFVGAMRTLADPSSEQLRCGAVLNGYPDRRAACKAGGGGISLPHATHHTLHHNGRQRCCGSRTAATSNSENVNDTATTRKSLSTTEVFRKCHERVHVRGNSQYRTARMLIIVSSVFVVLNLPSHVFRVHAFIQTSLADQLDSRGHTDVRWHELFQLVYHLNFAINFFIYSMCGRQFRTGLRILYSRLVHRLTKCHKAILYNTTSVREV